MKQVSCRLRRFVPAIALAALAAFLFGCQSPDPAAVMRPMIETYVNAWNTGDFTQLERILHPKFAFRMSPSFSAVVGIDSLKQAMRFWRTAYPDFHITVEELVCANDMAAGRWTITATNAGPGERPPTGRRVNVSGMSFFHFAQGKLLDEWVLGNDLSWAMQLGYMLTPPEENKK